MQKRIDLKNVDSETYSLIEKIQKSYYESTISKTVIKIIREFPRLKSELETLKNELNEVKADLRYSEKLLSTIKQAELTRSEVINKIKS